MDPVIFIGMHRSGTSLLGRLVESLGLFAGTRQDENNEAIFFQRINEWLLAQSGGRWDHPEPFLELLRYDDVVGAGVLQLRHFLRSPRAIGFLGLTRYLRYRDVTRLPIHWGWKDPRNTYTLPVWLRVFPRAKVVCIERHGVDVANSLKVRADRNAAPDRSRYARYGGLAWLVPGNGALLESPRCMSLAGGLSLWELYQDRASEILAGCEPDRTIRVRYETLLASPAQELRRMATFCGLTVTDTALERVTGSVASSRAYAYRKDARLAAFAKENSAALERWGYEA